MFTDSKLTIYTAGVEAPLLADSAASGPAGRIVVVVRKTGRRMQMSFGEFGESAVVLF